jgi:TRAP-type C4-dicarboxylate transport system permease small subunit
MGSDAAVADAKTFASHRALVIQRHRHLKWPALDWLEAVLMVLCGTFMVGFTVCVFFDVVTRTLQMPWLWLQQVTTGCFAWGVFMGIAAAARRHDHIYLAEITKRMTGTKRLTIETANRVIVMIVAGFMIWFGFRNALHDLGSFRMPSLIPLTYYTASVPLCGVLVALFMIEQIVNGWKNGFEGPEDTEMTGEHLE